MRHKKLTAAEEAFVQEIRAVEERHFAAQLDPEDASRMRNDGRYSWLYRPSHHARRGLVTQADIALLSQPGKRVLSVGAHPTYLEQALCMLGLPAENIVVADSNPGILECDGPMEQVLFDATEPWPELGTFDLIIFPESLCIAVRDRIQREGVPEGDGPFATDAREAELLAVMLGEALTRLRPGGEIRADGPMCHPAVMKIVDKQLDARGLPHVTDYQRFFLSLRTGQPGVSP